MREPEHEIMKLSMFDKKMVLKTFGGPLGLLSGTLGGLAGAMFSSMGLVGSPFGPLWEVLGVSWRTLGTLGALGASGEPLGASWAAPWLMLATLERSLAGLGVCLGDSYAEKWPWLEREHDFRSSQEGS